jgi:hypothetical protein
MKTLSLLTTLLMSFAIAGQSTLFKVITTQGKNKVTTSGTTIDVASGARLNSGSQVTVGQNSYLGLIHISGKTLEVKQAGKYDVEQLAKQFSTGQSSFTDKYADYVVSKMTSSEASGTSYNYTGAVKRDIQGAQKIVLWAPSESSENVVNILKTVPVNLNWNSIEGVKEYKVIIKTFDESQTLLEQSTVTSSISLNLNMVAATTDAPYFIEIMADNKAVAHSMKPFYLLDEEGSAMFKSQLEVLKKNVDESTALGNLILGSFFEENKLSMYAISSYQKAVELEPTVEEYKSVRNIYFNNHEVLFEE